MSIQKRARKKGDVYVVHYYDTDQHKYVNRTFDRKKDAEVFEATIVLAKRRGELDALDAGTQKLREFEKEWWQNYAERHLSTKTRLIYRDLLDKRILPELGAIQLRKINPLLISRWASRMKTDGVGDWTIRKSMVVLQGILERAVEWQQLSTNPVKAVKKPEVRRQRDPRPLSPDQVENIRAALGSRDATLVSVLAYAGLRPGEALALTWEDVGEVLNVDKSLSLGEIKETKTGSRRGVRILGPLRADLRAFALASGNRSGLLFPDSAGRHWTDSEYRDWRRRVWSPAAPVGTRLYDLRHSFASLLFAEGRNPAEIAEQLGHTLQTLLTTYVRVIEELRDTERVHPEQLIRDARANAGAAGQEPRAGEGTGS